MITQDNSPEAPTSTDAPIAIVGGGLAGTVFLVHTLARIAADTTITSPVQIRMLERYAEQLQGGVAYSKGPAYRGHNLNSGARTLNFFPVGKYPPGFPTFVEYIQEQAKAKSDPEILHALTDPPRQMVSEYISHMLDIAIEKAGAKANVDFEHKNIVALDKKKDGGAVLHCSDGVKIEASHVVLATGFQESLAPKFAKAVAHHPHFVGQPYTSGANAAYAEVCAGKCDDLLIIGTGLTGMDIAARLINQGYKGQITMMSRRGFMHSTFEPTSPEEYLAKRIKGEPRPQAELEFTKHPPKFLESKTTQLLVRNIIQEFTELSAQGYSSGEILGYWERFVPEVSAKFPKKDLAALWGAYEALITSRRAGVTPDTGVAVREAIASGQIKVETGLIKGVEQGDGKLFALVTTTQPNSSLLKTQFSGAQEDVERQPFDYVFSAMGNSVNFNPSTDEIGDPLWSDIMKKGYALPHWTKAGVDVGKDFSLLDAAGKPADSLSVIGVPVAGHMMVTKYPYPDSPGVSGGKIGPTALNAGAIMSETLLLLDAKYNDLVSPFRSVQQAVTVNATAAPAVKKTQALGR